MENFNANPTPDETPETTNLTIDSIGEESNPDRHIDIPRGRGNLGLIKNALLFGLLVILIVGSFWVSFNLGRKILTPAGRPEKKVDMVIPEPPDSIASLQSLEEIEEIERKSMIVAPEERGKETVSKDTTTTTTTPPSGQYYKIQAGFFHGKSNATRLVNNLKGSGISAFMRQIGKGWRVQAGAYRSKTYAKIQQKALKSKGFDAIIIYE